MHYKVIESNEPSYTIWEGPVLMDYNIAAEFDTPQAATAWFNRVSRSIKRREKREESEPKPSTDWLVTKITKAGRVINIYSEDKPEQSRLKELLKAAGGRVNPRLKLKPWYTDGWCWKCTLRIENNFSVDAPIASVLDQLAFILPTEVETISWIRKSQASLVKATPNRLVFEVIGAEPPTGNNLVPQAPQDKQRASLWRIDRGAVLLIYRRAPSAAQTLAQNAWLHKTYGVFKRYHLSY